MDETTIAGVVERVTDGDTVRVTAEGMLFRLRVLGLDTEESQPGGTKPVTAWGKAATAFAKGLLPEGAAVAMVFPGGGPVIETGADGKRRIATRHLDNFERPLAHLRLAQAVEGTDDFSALMIAKGFSPYFVKYGRVASPARDAAYTAAERAAQEADIGVWNQFEANGVSRPEDAPRNYAQLAVWWELRARVIDAFRAAREADPAAGLLNSRLDYDALAAKAAAGGTATVFLELRTARMVGGEHFLIDTGSQAQPFQLFFPKAGRPAVAAALALARNRYIADGEAFPRRNYAYVTGPLKQFGGRPELVVERADQITDEPPGAGA
jgi:micrococcal nuclease